MVPPFRLIMWKKLETLPLLELSPPYKMFKISIETPAKYEHILDADVSKYRLHI